MKPHTIKYDGLQDIFEYELVIKVEQILKHPSFDAILIVDNSNNIKLVDIS